MRTRILASLLVAFAVLALSCAAQARDASPRQRLLMDAGWRFHLGDLPYSTSGTPITDWVWKADDRAEASAAEMAAPDLDTSTGGWQAAKTGDDVFRGRVGFVWYRTTLPAVKGVSHSIHFECVDDNGTVYLNGKRLMYHEVWNDPFDCPLDAAWRNDGPNLLAVLVENTNGPGGITGATTLQTEASDASEGAPNPAFDDKAWSGVDLPHDYVVGGNFSPTEDRSHGYLPKGIGWYRKEFTLSPEDRGKTLWLEFDGIYRNSTVWLNGRQLGRHASGYTSFYYDIGKFANYGGRNVIAVRVDCTQNEGWWYEGGGIYRHVWLTKAAPIHVAHWGAFVTAEVEDGDRGGRDGAEITIKTRVANDGAQAADCRLVSRIIDPSGNAVASLSTDQSIAAGDSPELVHKIHLSRPRLWSLETPNLYRLQTSILQGRRTLDETETPFGIRTIRFDANKGFLLNGKPVKIKGTCNHVDFAGVGIAMPDRIQVYRVEKLLQMGSNAWRCSHNPPAEEMLDACDRLGMLVMDENRHLGSSPDILGQVESMVTRDRNHPSIIIWSMCNEEGLQGTEKGKQMFSAMMDVAHKYDTTRPISCAMNGGWGSGITSVEDLQGFNYNPQQYDPFHKAFPNMPVFGSETASHVSSRGEYADDRAAGYVSEYSGNPEWSWKPVAERDFVAGSFVWTGFDYRGEPSPYDWPCINSHFGIMDTCGFPKDAWWYYKAWWGDKPLVHILPHWNWAGREGQEIDVWAYSNADKVEILLNGKSLGVKDMPRWSHASWKVKYEPGRLEARAITNGKVVATDTVETTGAPAAVRLSPDRSQIAADGRDVSLIAVAITDDKGRVVPTASNLVRFSLSGPGKIIGVGNGDPSCHESDKARKRSAFNGYCMVIVQSTAKAGDIRLTASADGLKAGTAVIETGAR
jgi:beta-galactosidase